jgi:DNA-binding CsgD family transcriptional regulator
VSDLLERDDLLARLGSLRADGGRLVFVGGEAGVGKTSLVRAFATGASAPVLWGFCENLTTPTPLAPFLDVGDVASSGEPRVVARALLDALRSTTVLVVEDVHWGDQATLDVLRVLGRRIDSTPSLVLATYRDDEVTARHPFRAVLGELASAPGVLRLTVPRLSLDAVRELAAPYGADGDAIHRLTQGNAFYVTEILAAGGEQLPETVRDAVLARIALLGEAARRLLEVVAMVPARTELWLLEEVAAAELEQLDACLASGVLRADGDAVAFRHELARLAVAEDVPPYRRRALHAAILRALLPTGDSSRLAHHAEEAGDGAAVLEHARAAGRRAAQAFAHREAAAQYARALRHADTLPERERAELLVAYAGEEELTGGFDDAVAARREAIALFARLGDRFAAAEARSRTTIPLIRAGRNDEAEEASRAAIAELEALPRGRELALAYADQAYARMIARDNDAGVEWGRRAVAAARAAGDGDTLVYGLNMVGTSHVMAGRLEEGIPLLLESLELARREGLEFREYLALIMLGSGLSEMYDLERGEAYLRTCVDFAEAHELALAYPSAWLALVAIYRGRWDEGAATAGAVLARPVEPISRITALIALGRVRARRGDPGAWEALDEALELARPGGHLQRVGHVHAARAEAAWLAGDRERTTAEAQAVYGLALEKRHLWFGGELAYWQWKAGALDGEPDWLAEPYGLQLAGDARGAAAAWRAHGCPYEAARALAEADDEDALLEALAELDRLGALPAAKVARQALHARGSSVPRGPRPATRANPAALTGREVEVLRLLAEGKRNAEIAAELVLSTRTVDHHVSAILRKLEVRSRGEAVAAAGELGLLQPR